MSMPRAFTAVVVALLSIWPLGSSLIADQPNPSSDINSLGMKFISISPGTYRRGFAESNEGDRKFALIHPFSNAPNFKSESPSHLVQITTPFEMQNTEVTVAQFRDFVDATDYETDAEKRGNGLGYFPDERDYVDRFQESAEITWRAPGFDQTDTHPVVVVSWNDAMAFCRWLSDKESLTYRLPSEAEWEYACRAGTETWYSWGTEPDDAYSNANVADGELESAHPNTTRYQRAVRLGAEEGDGAVFTAPAGSYSANPWGLHDMHGNAWEWCRDRWQADLYRGYFDGVPRAKRSAVSVRDPLVLDQTDQHAYGDWRTIRGGAWTCAPASVRSSIRTFAEAGDAAIYTGFRVVREP